MTEERFVQLEEAKAISQSTFPKIQKVPNHLRNREKFTKYYSPKLLSLGPIHHGNPDLELGEQYKLTWASMYIESFLNLNPRYFYEKISSNIQELKKLYTEDALGEFKTEDESLSWMRAMNDFLQRHHFSQKKPSTDYRRRSHKDYEMDDPRPHAPPHLLDQLRWNLLRDFRPQPYEDVVKEKDYVMKKEYRAHIERHYRQKHKWFRMGYHTHCSNPWAIIAILAAFLVLSLTFVQTWFAVFPRK